MKAEIDSGTLILPESSARRKSSRVSCIVWQKVRNSAWHLMFVTLSESKKLNCLNRPLKIA